MYADDSFEVSLGEIDKVTSRRLLSHPKEFGSRYPVCVVLVYPLVTIYAKGLGDLSLWNDKPGLLEIDNFSV